MFFCFLVGLLLVQFVENQNLKSEKVQGIGLVECQVLGFVQHKARIE